MAADGSIAITPGTGRSVRTIEGVGVDNADQQVMTLADETGIVLMPLSEDTGQAILRELRKHTLQLAELSGCFPSDTDVST